MKVEFHDRAIKVDEQWFSVGSPIGGRLGLKQVFGYDDLARLSPRHFFLLLFLVSMYNLEKQSRGRSIHIQEILNTRLPEWNTPTAEDLRKGIYKAFASSSCVEMQLGYIYFNPSAEVEFSIHLPNNQSVADYLRSQRTVVLKVTHTGGLVIHRALHADGLGTTWYRPACSVQVKKGVVILTTNAAKVTCVDCIALPSS